MESHEVFWPIATLVEQKRGTGPTPAGSQAIRSARLYYPTTARESFSSNCTPMVTLDWCPSLSRLIQTLGQHLTWTLVVNLYSALIPNNWRLATSWRQSFQHHSSQIPSSTKGGCCDSARDDLQQSWLSHGHYTGFTTTLEYPKASIATVGICVWVGGDCCWFLLTLKSMLSLASLHDSGCDLRFLLTIALGLITPQCVYTETFLSSKNFYYNSRFLNFFSSKQCLHFLI